MENQLECLTVGLNQVTTLTFWFLLFVQTETPTTCFQGFVHFLFKRGAPDEIGQGRAGLLVCFGLLLLFHLLGLLFSL